MAYEVEAVTKVFCDGTPDGVPCKEVETRGVHYDRTQANAVVVSLGWMTKPKTDRHICPGCWEKGER